MKNLYSFYWDCGRMGDLQGLFVATPEQIESAIGRQAYFGEVLGKHSEIYGSIDRENITLVSNDHEKVKWLLEVTGGWDTISGFNPLEYLEEEFSDEENEIDQDEWLPEDEDDDNA